MYREYRLKLFSIVLLVSFSVSGCITVPVPAEHQATRCEISMDRLTLRVVDVTKGTNYYKLEGYLVSPILVPATAILSGAYVLVHNTYYLGKERIVCG